ncbi:MAG: hypothetical protein HY695_04055 [Deltaproteobacteria bacterium]|nr:hypothetical protein [Deltaproteobacteria bacterium]
MELMRTCVTVSPYNPTRVRLVGQVTYDDRQVDPEEYWFDVPEKYADSLSTTGNPWLVCLLPLAMSLGEPLRLSVPIDGVLLENVSELMQLWKYWYPHLRIIPVEADLLPAEASSTGRKTAAFFSGGVDSFFTLLRRREANRLAETPPIDELLSIWGFDIPLHKRAEFHRMLRKLRDVAANLQTQLIDIATNLRETRLGKMVDWAYIVYGCALATVGLVLEKRYARLLIPSCWGYKDLRPWGSHPLTDPLLSTSQLRIIYDGAAFDRVQKTEFIANFDLALRALRVCWKEGSDVNCSACNKCYRTMATLEILGVLDRCRSFAEGKFDLTKLARVYCADDNTGFFFREVQELALRKGRFDVVKAIDSSFRYSRMLNWFLPLVRSLEQARFVWRFKNLLERALLARAII